MTNNEISHLFKDRPPSLEEFASFGVACSQLTYSQLYEAALSFPEMHWLLKKTVLKHLEEKIQAENASLCSEELTKRIPKGLAERD